MDVNEISSKNKNIAYCVVYFIIREREREYNLMMADIEAKTCSC